MENKYIENVNTFGALVLVDILEDDCVSDLREEVRILRNFIKNNK